MYPSMEKKETSDICAEMVVKSGLYFEAINWEEAGNTEGIPEQLLPTRKYSSGAKPSITTVEVLGPLSRDPSKSKFNPPLQEPNQSEGRKMLKEVI